MATRHRPVHTRKGDDEHGFMASLMADLDGSVFDEGPTPPQRALASASHVTTTSPLMTRTPDAQRDRPVLAGQRKVVPHFYPHASPTELQRARGAAKENPSQPSAHGTGADLGTGKHLRVAYSRKRSGSWQRMTPSPRKRGVLTETQARSYAAEIEEATGILRDESNSWLACGMDDELSPKASRAKVSPRKQVSPPRSPSDNRSACARQAKCAGNSACKTLSADNERPDPSRYVRCKVDSIDQSMYVPRHYSHGPMDRYTTSGVNEQTVRKAMARRQVVLHLSRLEKISSDKGEESHKEKLIAVLRDDWTSTYILPGDVVHLIGIWSSTPELANGPKHINIELEDVAGPSVLGDVPTMVLSADSKPTLPQGRSESENLLVAHPDVLLSATAVSSVISCTRKPFLQAKMKASGPGEDERPSEALIMGRMLHEVLQSCLTGTPVALSRFEQVSSSTKLVSLSTFPPMWTGSAPTRFADSYVREQVFRQVQRSVDDLLLVNMDTEAAHQKLWDAVQPFGHFATSFLGQDASSQESPTGKAVDVSAQSSPLVRILKIHDVEEDIWSPMYGLKGFVDVTVEVALEERPGTTNGAALGSTLIMPLELKTGRSFDIAQHRAQTMLYTLMMSDRYKRPIDGGLLYYSKSAEMHLVRRGRKEVRSLLMARNDLAGYLVRRRDQSNIPDTARGPLPPTIDNERTCNRCFVKDACMLYRKAVESVCDEEETDDATPIAALYASRTGHLKKSHLDFFRKWESLLSDEEADVVRYRREMWTMTAEAREKTGRCYSDMSLQLDVPVSNLSVASRATGMLHSYVYHLGKNTESPATLLAGNFTAGDPICVSVEPDVLSVAQGYLLEVSPQHVTISVDKSLEAILVRCGSSESTFRIDKEELLGGMARVRYNLAKLFLAPPLGDSRRRELIVDLKAPIFRKQTAPSLWHAGNNLNKDQILAIDKALSAEDYALIVGMPGTGKTTTIVRLIAHLASKGKTVLLTSYTHSAVDTICRKLLKEEGINLLRLGSADRVHTDVRTRLLQPSATVEELARKLHEPNVVATTCLSIGHSLFAQRPTFDYCIVDEASQITLPTCIGPLRYGSKFVLVGDPQQLPPLVRDERARQGGLDVSLFEHLQKAHPDSVAYLCQQYRMNDDIMALSNALVYEGRLRCGDEGVRSSVLEVPKVDEAVKTMHNIQPSVFNEGCPTGPDPCFLRRILSPATRAIFVDTDGIAAHEKRTGDLVENETEARLALQLCSAFLLGGVPGQEIAILTPYRQQIRSLTRLLHAVAGKATQSELIALREVEVLTADKAQGRDKDVVIVSFVRSRDMEGSRDECSDEATVGQLLLDARRINVALTRARKKLIILGSASTLRRAPLLAKLWKFMESHNWTWDLSDDDILAHWSPGTPNDAEVRNNPEKDSAGLL